MDGGLPTLEVGFAIDTENSFESLQQLQAAMDTTEGQILAEAARIEKATSGMIKADTAKANITAIGGAYSREMEKLARSERTAEAAAERMIKQLDWQTLTYGKTTEQIRQMRVEQRALAADTHNLTEVSERLRNAEAALANKEKAAIAARKLADEHERLAQAVRGSHAAQEADAVAAEKMRMATDPLYAATVRLNQEIAESTRLYRSGATAPAEYARQQEYLANRLNEVTRRHDMFNQNLTVTGKTGQLASHHMQNLAFQFQDVGVQLAMAAQSSEPFKMATMALVMQGTQIHGIMQQAQMSTGDLMKVIGRGGTRFAPYIAAIGGAAFMLDQYTGKIDEAANTDAFVRSLGLTQEELKELGNTGVTMGDTLLGTWDVIAGGLWDIIGPAVIGTKQSFLEWFWESDREGRESMNNMIGYFVGGFNAIRKTWAQLPAAFADVFVQAVNAGIRAINSLIQKSVQGVNGFIEQANAILSKAGLALPTLAAGQISQIESQHAGAASKVGDIWRDEMDKASKDYFGALGSAISDAAIERRNARLLADAKELIDKRPDGRDQGNDRAERLAREAAAMESQIRNLYALAEAYRVSGAEALVAEARVKAEAQAIKQRGDVEEYVARQIRLEIAQRVSDAAKASAAVREQADAQRRVNEMVAAGIVPAERAMELVKDQIADLPLLAALQVAQQRGLTAEVEKATQALQDQRLERERLREEERRAMFLADMTTGANRLAELRLELGLIGAINSEREMALAVLRATQEAEAKGYTGEDRDRYIEQQREIALETQNITRAIREQNDALMWTADRWELIARNIQSAGIGMAEAFGGAGRALNDLALIYADYHATQARLEEQHKQRLAEGADIEREAARYALQTATLQIGAFGDMTAAAKGFFDEKSKGYKALEAAEKAFRAVEFALSIRAMAQDIVETGSKLASSAARAAANGVEAVAKALASLPFPANLAAGAVTAAALAAIGVQIVGAFGGGGKNNLTPANDGTGTVLGDATAQSESIKNAINALKEVDTVTSIYAREMASSLRSINSQIGNVASVLVRGGDVNGVAGISEGFNANFIGKVLGAIPIVGGLLKSLFGSKTTVVGGGLYGGPQSLSDILAGGFDAQTYSDIQKKKKFFGITTGTSYSTQYGSADPGLENQFTLILKSFNDAILASAGPLGIATDEITQRLSGFVVNIGKIDLKDLTGQEIEEKLQAVFGAAADNMAKTAFPGIEKFQKVGEGLFETLVRVASTAEAVAMSMNLLGDASLTLEARLGLADQFDTIGDLTSAVDAYFQAFYTKEEQAAAKTAQMTAAIESLGFAMPQSLASFRDLVEAQDLTTEAGRKAYAMLLQLAPAFADLQEAMNGAKSAADIASERENLQRQIYQLLGNTAALRAMDLAKIDASNRALQEQVWAIEDAKEAARAAQELRDAWSSVGDSIMDEVERIRGLTQAGTPGNFAALLGQFNAATTAARSGDKAASEDLPGLSQSLLAAAELVATSRQELDRIRAMTAASLEATNAAIADFGSEQLSDAQILAAAGEAQQATQTANDNPVDEMRSVIEQLKEELAGMRADTNNGLATVAGNTGKIARKLDDVTAASGGDAISTVAAA